MIGYTSTNMVKCKWDEIVNYYKDNFYKYNYCEDSQIINEIISWVIVNQDYINFDTKIYITPWYKLQIVDHLITNFHLPKSTLFIMVSSIIWLDNALMCYDQAKKKGYKFYSLWDAMFII